MDASTTSSLCFDIESLGLENDIPGSKSYSTLGLKETFKKNNGNPKVLSLISSHLERSVRMNEALLENPQTKDVITVFHGSRAPELTIKEYIDRIFKYSRCSPSCFVVAQVYMDRFIQCGNVNLTSLSVHRLLITSIMLAAKFIDDAFYNNAYYAKVGGVTTAELNRLEMKFLFGLDFRLHVSLRTFGRYCSELEKEISYEPQIERPLRMNHTACGLKKTWSSNDDSSSYATTEIHIV
ncbi:cyclin-P3-1-like [Rutidosis leptorrhynchoides]|uniref:cyclin-P3-1-like n=1 Tax=Rutidosis leptorrhynchoides TaxID=125765 RepID=UPI003A995150